MTSVRDHRDALRFGAVADIARFEWRDALQSRRAMAMTILFLLASAGGCWVFLRTLARIEAQVLESFGVDGSGATGEVSATLWSAPAFRRIMIRLVGNRELAERLLNVPPLALFHAWFMLAVTPLLVMLTSTTRLADEIQSGAARFVLARIPRSAWLVGKFAGQAGLLAMALGIAALAAAAMGAWMSSPFDIWAHAVALTAYTARAWVYALPFLALALLCSHLAPTPHAATAAGFVVLIALHVFHTMAQRYADGAWGRGWDLVAMALPMTQRGYLWWNDFDHLAPALLTLGILSAGYLALGYPRLARRNL